MFIDNMIVMFVQAVNIITSVNVYWRCTVLTLIARVLLPDRLFMAK